MRILIGFLFVFATSIASAQIVFAPSISYITHEEEDNGGGKSAENMMFADFRLGYLHPSGLYLGGMYSMSKYSDATTSANGFSVGPTLGFSHYNGFYALFTYYIMAEQKNLSNSAQTYTDGMGPQVDIGWSFPITASFHIGPQITYRSVTFDKIDSGGAAIDNEHTIKHILPALNLWVIF